MRKVKCDTCRELFDRDRAAAMIDEEYGNGTYDYYFLWNNFCFSCAEDIIDEGEDYDEDNPPPGCRECGGNYPYCCDSCPIYDD